MNTENLKKARKAAHLTQMQAAKVIGVSDGTYKNYEQGKREPNNTTLVKIAEIYGVTTDFLLGKEDALSSSTSDKYQGDVDDAEKILFEKYLQLPPEARKSAIRIMRTIADELRRSTVKDSDTKKPDIVETTTVGVELDKHEKEVDDAKAKKNVV